MRELRDEDANKKQQEKNNKKKQSRERREKVFFFNRVKEMLNDMANKERRRHTKCFAANSNHYP
jgi:hypothetical protein